jgi:hypothetical protein
MATKKKTKKKQSKPKKTAAKKAAGNKKTTGKKTAPKKVSKKLPKKSVRKAVQSKTARMNAVSKRAAVRKKPASTRKRVREQIPDADPPGYSVEEPVSRPGGQSGDLQGLSSVEGADSESVQELLEEGNAFEADVVTGVERAGDRGTKEVRTREVPEDDVPEEYLDNEP